MIAITVAALLCAITLLVGWLAGYAMGKNTKRQLRVVHPEPEIEYVTRLTSRHERIKL